MPTLHHYHPEKYNPPFHNHTFVETKIAVTLYYVTKYNSHILKAFSMAIKLLKQTCYHHYVTKYDNHVLQAIQQQQQQKVVIQVAMRDL